MSDKFQTPLDLDEQQKVDDQFLIDSDVDQLAKKITSVYSEIKKERSLSDQGSPNNSEPKSDLEERILERVPGHTLEELRDHLDGVY